MSRVNLRGRAARIRRWMTAIGVLALLGLGVFAHSERTAPGSDPEREVGARPTNPSAPLERGGVAPVGPRIEAGALRLEGLVLDDEEQPVGGAQVTLEGARIAVTEADGSFAFDGLAPRQYALIAELGAWYGEQLAATLDETSDPVTIELVRGPTLRVRVVGVGGAPIAGATVATSSREVVTGASGIGVLRGVDLGVDHLRVSAVGHARVRQRLPTGDDPTATIERTIVLVSGSPMSGTVIDEAGNPVADASVELDMPNGETVEWITSDDAGGWTSEDIGAGTYLLHATSERYVETKDLVVPHDGIQRTRGIVVRVARGGEIAGIVTDPGGTPIEGVEVAIGTRRVTTGADGRFLASGLDLDRYDVTASNERAGAASQTVRLAARGRADIKIVLEPSGIAGIVVDPSGDAIEDLFVYARSDDPNGYGVARTDDRGRFDLGGLPPGDYELEAKRNDLASGLAGTVVRVHSGTRTVRIELPELASIAGRVVRDGVPLPYFGVAVSPEPESSSTATPHPVREAKGTFIQRGLTAGAWTVVIVGPGFERRVIEHVRLTAGATTELGDIAVTGGDQVHGVVVDERGQPVPGAKVTITAGRGGGQEDRLRALRDDVHTTTTDGRGAYRIDGLSATETREIEATHPAQGSSGAQPVAPGQRELRLVIRATGTIGGTLVNLTPAARVYGVYASPVDGPHASLVAELDAQGRFELVNVPPGEYSMRVRGRVVVAEQVVRVVAGSRAEVDFELARDPVTLIVDVDGECSLLWLRAAGSSDTLAFASCSDGHTTFEGVSPGRYDLCPERTDCRAVEVPAQPEVTVRITVQSP